MCTGLGAPVPQVTPWPPIAGREGDDGVGAAVGRRRAGISEDGCTGRDEQRRVPEDAGHGSVSRKWELADGDGEPASVRGAPVRP